jgi:hypothetical protein
MNDQSCANCNFSVTNPTSNACCHRHAPSPEIGVSPHRWAVWPVVRPTDWCGEWAPILTDEELFANYWLARSTSIVPPFSGIPVPPVTPAPEPGSEPPAPFTTYDDHFEDPLR